MSIKINEFLAEGLGKAVSAQEANGKFSTVLDALGDEECGALAAAEEYIEEALQGTGAITEEILDAKLEEFTRFAPDEPATEQELAAFAEKFAELTFKLYEKIPASASFGTEEKAVADFMRAKLPGNPNLQQQLLKGLNDGSAK